MDRLMSMAGLARRAGKVRFGAYMTQRCVRDGSAKAVIIASDLGRDNRKKIEAACGGKIPVRQGPDRREMGRALGKKEVSVFCICDENLAAGIIKITEMAGKEGLPDE